jgi:hypothetical protein
MKKILDSNPVASIIAVIVCIVGGVVCIVDPSSIGVFKQYAVAVGASTAGLGILGYARSVGGKG